MVKRKREVIVPENISLLQNQIRKDPPSYREEFLIQQRHYETLRDLFKESPSETKGQEEFSTLIGFIAQMCSCYPKETKEFPTELATLLKDHHNELEPDLREKMVQSLTMLRNKSVISSEQLMHTLFPLLVNTDSKQMRTLIYSNLINIIKKENKGTKNQRLNRSLQALLFNLLTDHQSNGLWATKITRELWKRGIWDDARTVEIMSLAAMDRQDLKVACSAARFFLSSDEEREEAQQEDNEPEDDGLDMSSIKRQRKVNKKTAKREKKAEHLLNRIKKRGQANNQVQLNFSAIHLLHNAQGFAEQVFSTHLTNTANNTTTNKDGTVIYRPRLTLEQKLLFLKLVSRLVGNHKLVLEGLYTFYMKYLTLKQQDVTQFMAACSEACHDQVPPELTWPLVQQIAKEFVSDGVQTEACAAGLNTIGEIVKRAPSSLRESLLVDLVQYKDSKAKSVMMAVRKLIGLFREMAPSMLPKKEQGKGDSIQGSLRIYEIRRKKDPELPDDVKNNWIIDDRVIEYGQERSEGFEGSSLFKQWKDEKSDDEGDENDGWELGSDDENEDSDSDDGGEWISVDSDKEYSVSDSEDEDKDDEEKQEKKKHPKTKEEEYNTFIELASKDIMTPADFVKLDELRTQAGVDKILGKRVNEDNVDADALKGPSKYKLLREERIMKQKEEREGREKHGSNKGKKLADKAHSTTNKEKARKKNFMMMVHKREVQGKAKRSLRDKQRILRNHVSHQKKQKGKK